MRVAHLYRVSRWHIGHRHINPVEFACWKLCMVAWLAGWAGVALGVLYERTWLSLMFLTAVGIPDLYSLSRLRLARSSRIRCDWANNLPGVQLCQSARSPQLPVGRHIVLWCRTNASLFVHLAIALAVLLALITQTTLLDGALTTPLIELDWAG